MITVYKYPIPITLMSGSFTLILPKNAQIVHLDYQNNVTYNHHGLVLWALVDTNAPSEERNFEIALTGSEIRPGTRTPMHIKTLLLDGGSFVIHLFELT